MGVELFVRHARGVEPTWYGEILIRHARSALAELRHACDEVSALKSGLSGQAAIGTVVTSATDLVPRAVAAFKERHPQVLVSIEMDFSEALVQRLQDGKLDMVIARIDNPRELAELHYEALEEPAHAIVARAGHPLARKRRLAWPDRVPRTWVLSPHGNVLRDHLSDWAPPASSPAAITGCRRARGRCCRCCGRRRRGRRGDRATNATASDAF